VPLDVLGGAALGVLVATASSEARSKPATITARLASRLIQMPIPRPAGGGIE